MAPVLNLNNEVVKMRKDVKKVKVLTIRRLTRHIAKLKSKKGTADISTDSSRNARRLLLNVFYQQEVKPDDVTKTALQKEINFEKVCKKPNSTPENRAIARLATHPILEKKIAAIKEDVKAFKDARKKLSEEEGKTKQDSKQPQSAQNLGSKVANTLKQGKTKPVEKRKVAEIKLETGGDLKEHDCKRFLKEPDHSTENCVEEKSPSPPENLQTQTSENNTEVKVETVESIPEKKDPFVPKLSINSSDIEESDKEKEYFDDSTEERFYKQSSGFEDSDSDGEDDFFIGKVRQTKKKKSHKDWSGDREKKEQPSKDKAKKGASSLQVHKESPIVKAMKLKSVFCKSLAETKLKSSYMKRDTNLASAKDTKKVVPQSNTQLRKPQPSKGPAVKQQNKGRDLQQPIHPSWEASRKRKEQSQIAAFQGKKIIFDD
ncbi:serum response factor-binding protein 1 [Ascaphus truei]|uniref:serum response factor-binding protein 1 n=1 Tax=Ascaphus truei TaxID=8439 RepID=UPI003F59399B